jgi:hypothetical protein
MVQAPLAMRPPSTQGRLARSAECTPWAGQWLLRHRYHHSHVHTGGYPMMDIPSWGFHQSRGSSADAGRLACASGEGKKLRGDLVRKGMDMLATRPHVHRRPVRECGTTWDGHTARTAWRSRGDANRRELAQHARRCSMSQNMRATWPEAGGPAWSSTHGIETDAQGAS